MSRPIYCRECKSQKSYDRYPDKDYLTESGRIFMLAWKCRLCGNTAITSNPDYQPPEAEIIKGEKVNADEH